MHIKYKLLLLTVAMLTVAARMTLPVAAQEAVGAIRGTVTDQSGAVIQKATVTVTNKATQATRRVNAGDDGIFLVPNLLPGEYEVKIEAQGFATQVTTLTVLTGSTTPGDAALRAGNVGEVVDVVAEAPIIDKQNYKIDGVITRQKIDALPLNGRNFLQLAALEPGVAVNTGNVGNANVLFSVSIGGGSSALTRLTVDGGSILDPVTGNAGQNFSTETIQEFQISTFNFDLSTGVTSVGAINIVSRTGTNDLHGNAFLYFRDHSFSALPTFNRPNANFDPFFRRYQYGGAIGGPIKKDKAFFFGNVERLDQNAIIGSSVSGSGLGAIFGPAFAQSFNTTFNSPYEGWLVNARTDIKINEKNNLFARFSYDNNSAFAPTGTNDLPSAWRNNRNRDPNAQVGNTTILTQNLVNDLRFNYQRITNESDPPTAADCPDSNPGCIGRGGPAISIVSTNFLIGNNSAAPQSRFLDRYQTTDNINWVKGSHRFRFGGEWEHNYGHGTFGFAQPGALFLHNPATVALVNGIVNANLPAPVRPLYTIPLPASFTTGNITYNDLLQLPIAVGFVGFGNINQPQPFNEGIARQSNRYRGYGQDSWQIRPGLTVSYGVSYTYETNLQNHDIPKPKLIQPLIGDIGNPKKDTNNWAPSVGFAWDVGNKGKTVVRGGAGIYYDTVLFFNRLGERALVGPAGNGRVLIPSAFFQNNIAFPRIPGIPEPLASINPAVGASINFTSIPTKFTTANFLSLAECVPTNSIGDCRISFLSGLLAAAGAQGLTGIDVFKSTPPSAALSLLDPHLQIPYTQQFTMGIQRQLPGNMSLSADFVIRQRRHALSEGGGSLFLQDYNLFNRSAARGGPKIPRCVGADAISLTAQCSNGPIAVLTSSGREQYNALLLKLDKRFSNRIQFTASYAFSHLNGFYVTEDQTNWFGNPGPLDTDVHHRFSFSGVYQLPWNFQVSMIAIYASRAPFNARVGSTTDLNGDGTFGDTLTGLRIGSLGRDFGRTDLFRLVNNFNATFAGKPDGQGVTIPVLTLPAKFDFGDDFWSQDVRLTKSVKLSERLQLQGFFEMFNILNISNLTGYSTTIGASFGQPTARVGQAFGTGGPRAIQFGGRFSF
ncbi:MAG TPA: TonB-dependent receptor [Blastocatellia bacterium]|nr:TonB-dependent receptor [Blastocatellia bacterium]